MSDLWDGKPFADYAWHRCCGCRHDEGRGVGGSPPWHVCTLKMHLQAETNDGLECGRYSPLPWVKKDFLP